MRYLIHLFILLVLTVSLFIPVEPAQAQFSTNVNDVATTFNIPSGNNLAARIAVIINVFLGLVAIVAVIYIIYGGIQYIISQGDEGKAENGKRIVLYAVIGLVIIGISAVVVNFVLSAIRGTTPL